MNRQEAIERVNNCINDQNCINCDYKKHMACKHFLMSDVLAILKEQEMIIKNSDQNKAMINHIYDLICAAVTSYEDSNDAVDFYDGIVDILDEFEKFIN